MPKNILFIGPYRQNDGWGEAAKQYIHTLIKTGCNLTIRPIYMGHSIGEIPFDFLDYESNILPHYDVVIQNVLPHFVDYNSKFGKNIALIYTETGNWQNAWPKKLSRMDEVWVPSQADVDNIMMSNCNISVKKVNIPIDVNKFNKSYEGDDIKIIKDENKFTFYFIGEFIQRKGIEKLIQAFHTEFDPSEPVNLVIKTNKAGVDPNQLAEILNNQCNKIKGLLRIYNPQTIDKYKHEMFITNRLPDDGLLALHNYCDCLVMPSCGESWSMPVADALGFGKTPIIIDETGPSEMVNDTNGYVVPSKKDYVLVLDPPLADIYTGREIWRSFTIYDLCKQMRVAYEERNTDKRANKVQNGKEAIYQFSYESVAERIKELI